jgi:hypothetical protein
MMLTAAVELLNLELPKFPAVGQARSPSIVAIDNTAGLRRHAAPIHG